jgi:hypothetical protein
VKHWSFVAIAAPAILLAACMIDLDGLTGGRGGAGSTSSASSGTGGGGASVLACDPCPDGGCAPQVLAGFPEVNDPSAIAVTSEGLYWTNHGSSTVMRLPASGGPPAVLSAATGPVALAVAGGYAVWAEQDGVHGCAVTSCGAPIKIAASTVSGSIQGVAYDGQSVYFTDQGNGGSSDGAVLSCPPQASCPLSTLGTALFLPLGIAVYGTQVFWTNQGDGQQNGSVDQSPKGASGVEVIASSLSLATGVGSDGADAYWTEATATGGKVRRCPSGANCQTPEDLATGLAAPLGLAVGGGRVYWADGADGTVQSCPSAGCGAGQPTMHASGRTGARAVALGATCLFWIDEVGGGSIVKVGR